MKENLHLDKLQVENCLVISLHLSAVNFDQLSVVFLLGNPIPFHFAMLVLGVQPFSDHCCNVAGIFAFLCHCLGLVWYKIVLCAAPDVGEQGKKISECAKEHSVFTQMDPQILALLFRETLEYHMFCLACP